MNVDGVFSVRVTTGTSPSGRNSANVWNASLLTGIWKTSILNCSYLVKPSLQDRLMLFLCY